MSKTENTRLEILEGIKSNYIAAGATLVMTAVGHAGKTIRLDTAAGSTCTLPAATGSGRKYNFLVTTLATSNDHIIKVANVTDTMTGIIVSMDDTAAAAVAFAAVDGTSDTITLNRTTTGSVTLGENIQIEDVAITSTTNRYLVKGVISNSGTPATPFSATV